MATTPRRRAAAIAALQVTLADLSAAVQEAQHAMQHGSTETIAAAVVRIDEAASGVYHAHVEFDATAPRVG